MKKLIATAIAVSALLGTTGEVQAKPTGIYKNCKAFNAKYSKGVRVSAKTVNVVQKRNGTKEYRKSNATVSKKVYDQAMRVNPQLDRDKDKIACEK